jgi:hypothetical protein
MHRCLRRMEIILIHNIQILETQNPWASMEHSSMDITVLIRWEQMF